MADKEKVFLVSTSKAEHKIKADKILNTPNEVELRDESGNIVAFYPYAHLLSVREESSKA